MRIATWNLAGRWSDAHAQLLDELDADVLLLTEVSDRVSLPAYDAHLSVAEMVRGRRWAGVLTRAGQGLVGLPDPHDASALARVGPTTFCSSILPWRSCGGTAPWIGENHADRTAAAVQALLTTLSSEGLVWGGDFNHALSGPEHAGSKGGRAALLEAVAVLDLQVPTADLPHQIDGLLTIDHIAVPSSAVVRSATRVTAVVDGRPLSDHDAYVVELA